MITGVMDEWQVQIYLNSLASGAAIYDRTDAVWFPSSILSDAEAGPNK